MLTDQSLNPGNLKTELMRHMNPFSKLIFHLTFHEPIQGAYTELFAGLSPEVTLDRSGDWSKSVVGFRKSSITNFTYSYSLGTIRYNSKGLG